MSETPLNAEQSDQAIAWLISEGLESIETAPTDGTHIMGVNDQCEEAECYYAVINAQVGLQGWVTGEDASDPNWHQFTMFYPKAWYPISAAS